MIRQFIIAKISVSMHVFTHTLLLQCFITFSINLPRGMTIVNPSSSCIYMHRLSRNVAPEVRQATPYTAAGHLGIDYKVDKCPWLRSMIIPL